MKDTADRRNRKSFITGLTLAVLSLGLFTVSGCTGVGPTTVSRDRFDYTMAISESWKHQMLLNMVKIRYGDAPVFMDVSSVISQYQIAGTVNLGATITSSPWSSMETIGTSGMYVDRPTITYTPILGDKFARSMMAPIPPPAILSLLQGGYPADFILRMLVQEINGIQNRFGGEVRGRSADPEYIILSEKLRKAQEVGGVGLRVTRKGKDETALLILREKRDPGSESLSAEIRKILGLDPQATEFRVVYGTIASNDKEIAMLTRSFLELIVDLSGDIEVPAVDVEENRVTPSHVEKGAKGGKFIPLVRIRSSPEKPGDAFVSVRYRNSYFWISDRDLMSKKIFSFLMFVSTLLETGEKGPAPVVTIPTN